MMRGAVHMAERVQLPDPLLRAAIAMLVARTDRQLRAADAGATAQFARSMGDHAVAEHTAAANAQHYELPTEFFSHVLGPHLKYSSCYYAPGDALGDAEARALALTAEHADLGPGQRILELGCGWGSLTLDMARRYIDTHITAVSNSASQRAFILSEASRRGIGNVEVVTEDINTFQPTGRFDRVVSVEMFEHLANWPAILGRIAGWLTDGGRLFLHVFTHDTTPYRFDHRNEADFIAQHFFTGGIMPSHALIREVADRFHVEEEWRWSGEHYAQTARDWLSNYDANGAAIAAILRTTYGADWLVWQRRWRLFFLATAGLFGHRGGQAWGVSHYRLAPV